MKHPTGIWSATIAACSRQMADLKFNSVRLPWSNAIIAPGRGAVSVTTVGEDAYDHTNPTQRRFGGQDAAAIMDAVIVAQATSD